jgi:fructose-1,6-bisphosphatase/inositol monophosphatase family enzyme
LPQEIVQTAIAIAHEAGALVRETFPQTALTQVNLKGAVNPVTGTDTAAEALIIERLRAAFPDHRILAEETHGDDWRAWDEPGPPMWLIDPLDGTVNFAHGFPYVGVSLALLAEGRRATDSASTSLRSSGWRMPFWPPVFPTTAAPPSITTPSGWTISCVAATGCAVQERR